MINSFSAKEKEPMDSYTTSIQYPNQPGVNYYYKMNPVGVYYTMNPFKKNKKTNPVYIDDGRVDEYIEQDKLLKEKEIENHVLFNDLKNDNTCLQKETKQLQGTLELLHMKAAELERQNNESKKQALELQNENNLLKEQQYLLQKELMKNKLRNEDLLKKQEELEEKQETLDEQRKNFAEYQKRLKEKDEKEKIEFDKDHQIRLNRLNEYQKQLEQDKFRCEYENEKLNKEEANKMNEKLKSRKKKKKQDDEISNISDLYPVRCPFLNTDTNQVENKRIWIKAPKANFVYQPQIYAENTQNTQQYYTPIYNNLGNSTISLGAPVPANNAFPSFYNLNLPY